MGCIEIGSGEKDEIKRIALADSQIWIKGREVNVKEVEYFGALVVRLRIA